MDYGEILSKAWRIIWKHKVLWLFGILAGCGSGGNAGSGGSGGGGGGGGSGSGSGGGGFEQWGDQIARFIESIPVWVWILLAILVLVIFLIAIFLGTVGRIGLIRGATQADQGAERLSFGELFSGSLPYFWRVFLLNLLIGLALFAAWMIIILLGVLVAIGTLGIGLLCLLPFLCLLIPASWLVSVVIEQANIAIVSENLGILEGLSRGWQVFRTYLGQMIVMAIILAVISLIVGLIIGLPAILIALPIIFGAISEDPSFLQGGAIVSVALFCIYLPILLVLNGAVTSFVKTAWVLTFRRLTGRAPGAAGFVEVVPAPAPTEPVI